MKIKIILLALLITIAPLNGADAWIQMNGDYCSGSQEGWGDVVADGVVKVLNGIEYFGQGFSKFAIRFFQL